MIYDRTCRGRGLLPGLSHSWIAGGTLYRGLGRLDAYTGASSWTEAFDWILDRAGQRPISEIQFWGHGKWGVAFIQRERFDADALVPGHRLYDRLQRIGDLLVPDRGLFWFRTCETFGRPEGHHFAKALTAFFGCRTAGHTYVIGPWQSGLHALRPGHEPHWSTTEGLPPGVERPQKALWSTPTAPNTITCLHGEVPEGF